MSGRQIAVCRTYADLHAALRARADELKLSRETLDQVAGFASGNISKILAPVPIITLGRVSLGYTLQALGLMLVVTEDADALAKYTSKATKRTEFAVRAHAGMPTRKRKRKRGFWAGNSEWGKLMSARRYILNSPVKRKRSASNAAKARWGRARREKRYFTGRDQRRTSTNGSQSPQ